MLSNSSRSSLKSENASPLVNGTQRSSRRLEVVFKQATKVTAITTKLEWRIDQFEKLMKLFKNGHNLISKQFSCPQAPSVIWELHVYPNGKRENDNNNVSFFLRQVGLQRGEDPIMTEFQIYTIDAKNCRISVCRDTKDFSNQQGRGKFQVQRDKMLPALRSDGSLMLICEVEYLPPGSKIFVDQEDDCEVIEEIAYKGELSIKESLREMFETELFSDCTIQCATKTFNVHRCILGQHSPVFRSMFGQTSMIEAQNGIIHITDSRPEAVRAMLEFIYTGSINNAMIENFAQAVLAIADKYAVFPLKEYCEKYLASIINKKNVASMAIIADMYFASHLKKACTRFISMHHKMIIRSSEWKELKNARSELANELLESVLNEQNSSDSYAGDVEDIVDNCVDSSLGGIPSSSSLLNNYSINGMNSSSSFMFDSNLLNNSPQSSTYSTSSSLNSSLMLNNGSSSNSNIGSSFSSQSSVLLLNNNNRNGIIQASGIFSSQRAARELSGALAQDTATTDEQTPSIRKRLRRGGVPVSGSNFTRSGTSSLISN